MNRHTGPISSPQEIVAWMKRIYRENGKINSRYVRKEHTALYGRAIRCFGGWRQAVESAGFTYSAVRVSEMRSWSKGGIVDAIKNRQRQGLSLNGTRVFAEDSGLYHAASRYFGRPGGWGKALKAAGIDTSDLQAKWKKSTIIQAIGLLAEQGIPLYGFYLEQCGYRSLVAGARNRFGGWKEAVEAAGFDYDTIRAIRPPWTDGEIIAEIRKLETAGVRLDLKTMNLTKPHLVTVAIAHFDGWSQAVEASGIDYLKHCRVWSSKTWLRRLDQQKTERLVERVTSLSRRFKRESREKRRNKCQR